MQQIYNYFLKEKTICNWIKNCTFANVIKIGRYYGSNNDTIVYRQNENSFRYELSITFYFRQLLPTIDILIY